MNSRVKTFTFILLAALGCFLVFNFTTTRETLNIMLGKSSAVTWFAVAISLVDFAGIARAFVPEKSLKTEHFFVIILIVVWLCAAVADIFLTWFWVIFQMASVDVALPVEAGGDVLAVFPWGVAFMEFAIRVPLVILIGQYWDKLLKTFDKQSSIGSSKAPQYNRTPQPVAASRGRTSP